MKNMRVKLLSIKINYLKWDYDVGFIVSISRNSMTNGDYFDSRRFSNRTGKMNDVENQLNMQNDVVPLGSMTQK